MAAFATVEDLEARWRPLSTAERNTAETLLGDAAVRIASEAPLSDPLLPTEHELETRKIVSCNMVKRAMSVADDMLGVTSHSDGTGPFQSQRTFANPMGELYLTKADRKLLGAGGQEVFTVPMHLPTDPVYWWESL